MKAGEPILGFPMNDSKSLIGSLKLQRKQADMWTANAREKNKTFHSSLFFSSLK